METNLVEIVNIAGDARLFFQLSFFFSVAIFVALVLISFFLGRKGVILFLLLLPAMPARSDTLDDILIEMQNLNSTISQVLLNMDPTSQGDYMRATLWAIENLIRGSEAGGGLLGLINERLNDIHYTDLPDILNKLAEMKDLLASLGDIVQGIDELQNIVDGLMTPIQDCFNQLQSIRNRMDQPFDVNIVSPIPLPVSLEAGSSVTIEGEIKLDDDDLIRAIDNMNNDQNSNWQTWGAGWSAFRAWLDNAMLGISGDLASIRGAVNDPLKQTDDGTAFRVWVQNGGDMSPSNIASGIKMASDNDEEATRTDRENAIQQDNEALENASNDVAEITDEFEPDTDVGLTNSLVDAEEPLPWLDLDFDWLKLGMEKDYDWGVIDIDLGSYPIFAGFFGGTEIPEVFEKKWLFVNMNMSDEGANLGQYANGEAHREYVTRFREKIDNFREIFSHVVTIGLFLGIIRLVRGLAPE